MPVLRRVRSSEALGQRGLRALHYPAGPNLLLRRAVSNPWLTRHPEYEMYLECARASMQEEALTMILRSTTKEGKLPTDGQIFHFICSHPEIGEPDESLEPVPAVIYAPQLKIEGFICLPRSKLYPPARPSLQDAGTEDVTSTDTKRRYTKLLPPAPALPMPSQPPPPVPAEKEFQGNVPLLSPFVFHTPCSCDWGAELTSKSSVQPPAPCSDPLVFPPATVQDTKFVSGIDAAKESSGPTMPGASSDSVPSIQQGRPCQIQRSNSQFCRRLREWQSNFSAYAEKPGDELGEHEAAERAPATENDIGTEGGVGDPAESNAACTELGGQSEFCTDVYEQQSRREPRRKASRLRLLFSTEKMRRPRWLRPPARTALDDRAGAGTSLDDRRAWDPPSDVPEDVETGMPWFDPAYSGPSYVPCLSSGASPARGSERTRTSRVHTNRWNLSSMSLAQLTRSDIGVRR